MNMLRSILLSVRNIRPNTMQADGASAEFHVRGTDHLIGLTPLGLILIVWLILMLA